MRRSSLFVDGEKNPGPPLGCKTTTITSAFWFFLFLKNPKEKKRQDKIISVKLSGACVQEGKKLSSAQFALGNYGANDNLTIVLHAVAFILSALLTSLRSARCVSSSQPLK